MSFLTEKGGSVKGCLTFGERSSTPPEIRKYRRSANLEPGKRFQHYGIADDLPRMDLDAKTFGEKSEPTRVTASDLLKHEKLSDLQKINFVKSEKVYKGAAREQLGKTYTRGYNDNFKKMEGKAFGIQSVSSLEPAKDIIFPTVSEEALKAEEIYKRTHGAYPAGEQKHRGYKFPDDPDYLTTTRFGIKGDTIALNGVSKNVTDVLKSVDDRAPLVNTKNVEDFRETKDILGRSKNLGQGSASRPIDYVYGKPGGNQIRAASGKTPIGAWEVIRGNYTEEDQLPDRDLGKTLTPGFRNITLEARPFGVPSIRTDLPKPGVGLTRSVANNMNYGDDATAHDLINPQPYADLRITETSMYQPRSREKLYAFFDKIGFSVETDIMDAIFDYVSTDGLTSNIQSFRHELNFFLEARDTGREEDWRRAHGLL